MGDVARGTVGLSVAGGRVVVWLADAASYSATASGVMT